MPNEIGKCAYCHDPVWEGGGGLLVHERCLDILAEEKAVGLIVKQCMAALLPIIEKFQEASELEPIILEQLVTHGVKEALFPTPAPPIDLNEKEGE